MSTKESENIGDSENKTAKQNEGTSLSPEDKKEAPAETGAAGNNVAAETAKEQGKSSTREGSTEPKDTPNKPFECSCSRSFETQRGLSLHLAHSPGHHKRSSDQDSTTTRSPSPTGDYNMASFKPSPRNPQYYSIIRTRRGTVDGETGTKRAKSSSAGAPPAKTLQLNSGEKVPAGTDIQSEDSDLETSQKKKPKAGKRRRTKSTSPKPEEEGGLKSSPITRANAASMKAPEFVSLQPPRRSKRGRGRGSSANSIQCSEERDLEEELMSENSQIEAETPEKPKSTAEKAKPVEADKPSEQAPVKKKRGRPPKNRTKEPIEIASKKPNDEKAKTSKVKAVVNENDKSWESFESENTLKEDEQKTKKSNESVAKKRKVAGKGEPAEQAEGSPEPEETVTKRTRSKTRASQETKADKQASSSEQNGTKTDSKPAEPEESDEKSTITTPPTEATTTEASDTTPRPQTEAPSNTSPTFMPPPPFHYPGPYPPPLMYPHPPSGFHPYYGYPGSGPYPVPPPHPGMVPVPHPGSPLVPPGELSPHGPGGGFPPPPQSTAVQTTSTSVKVSVLDKPPTQLPTASLPVSRPPRPMYPMESPGNPPIMSPGAMMRPPYLPMPSPEEMHPLSHAYRPGVMGPIPPGYHMHPGYHPPPHPHLAVRLDPSGMPYMDWADRKPMHGMPATPEEHNNRPVECPECGRIFKNNKALNGHMRLHGGFDWTKKPYSSPDYPVKPLTMNKSDSKEDEKGKKAKKRSRSGSRSPSPASSKTSSASKHRKSADDKRGSDEPLPVPRAPDVFTFDKVDKDAPSHNATLDDLCRAAALLDSIDGDQLNNERGNPANEPDTEKDDNGKRRPKNITIPGNQSTSAIEREKVRLGATPPYTPPPILSPSRSMTMLAGVQPSTPCRILSHWSSRRSSDGHPLSENEEVYNEPRINVGKEFQAELPPCSGSSSEAVHADPHAVKVWQVIDDLTPEDEATIDGYLEVACSSAVLHSGRNKELALHLLYQLGGSVKEAVRCLLAGKSVFRPSHPMAGYNYSGSNRWTARERQQFRRAWRVHRKQFHLLGSAVETKGANEMIEYYYTWKKYCSDEYRGRNRHYSEEILSDDEIGELRSSSSDGSGDHDNNYVLNNSRKTIKHEKTEDGEEHLPIVYAPHTSHPGAGTGHQYKCKYPGCNQIFTSIFALNGHIRVHGGSFYPRPYGAPMPSLPSKPSGLQNSTHPPFTPPRGKSPNPNKADRSQQLELAKVLLDLPRPRSPSRAAFHTPSPKPSPQRPSPAAAKKKVTPSTSPGEREGFYPCNRCGRVFNKVKSRSAHMKSHIVKQN